MRWWADLLRQVPAGFVYRMCRMAVAAGTSKALHAGPGIVTRDEVWQLMEEVTIKSV